MLAATPGTSDTPRAHITNMAALECLRDIDLERECNKVSDTRDSMKHTRWCRSMAGEEYARIYSWGKDPHRVVCGLYILSASHSNSNYRAIMMRQVHASMSTSPRQSSNRFFSTMHPRTASLVASIQPSSPSNVDPMIR
jgi:hypothetical protein